MFRQSGKQRIQKWLEGEHECVTGNVTMALSKNVQGDTKPISTTNNQPAYLESAVAKLAAVLSHCKDEHDKGDGAQVAGLLERLGEADAAAQGVEERLDGIIGNLDALLVELQKESASEKPVESNVPENSDETKSS